MSPRRLIAATATALLTGSLVLVSAAPASANHTCSTEICYPDLCINIHQKPYSVFC